MIRVGLTRTGTQRPAASQVLDLDSTDGGMDALGGDLSCPYPMGLQTLIEAPCDADFIPKPMLPSAPPAEALPAPPPPRWGPWPPGWVLAVAAAGVALPLLAFAAALRVATPPPPPPPPAEGGKQAEEVASATSPSVPEAEPQAEPQPPGSGSKSSSKKKRKGKGGKGAGKGPAEPGPAASEEGSRHSHSHGSAGSSGGPLPGERAALLRERYDEPGGIVCIGRMRLDTARTLGMGSAGTVVYEGTLDGRRVAIKRLLSQFYDLARKELDTLVRSDDHPNVVRCFALEEDREFVYLALELCSSSLADLVERARGTPLLIAGGQPTPLAMSIAAEVTAGLAALHARGIVHRDLKPANVLMTEGSVAKVSDMGLCKRLVEEQSSFESVGPGGSSGWQAPEQLRQRLPGGCPAALPPSPPPHMPPPPASPTTRSGIPSAYEQVPTPLYEPLLYASNRACVQCRETSAIMPVLFCLLRLTSGREGGSLSAVLSLPASAPVKHVLSIDGPKHCDGVQKPGNAHSASTLCTVTSASSFSLTIGRPTTTTPHGCLITALP